ncbi:MAG TPA: prolipoprotein diacylglyceryl transferase family protein, partial [Dehalococcoidales bacterium]
APLGVPTHPTTVYEIIYLLIIFGVVIGLRNRLKPDGSLFMVYLSLYSVWRLGIDFLRDGTPFIFGLHEAQFIAIVTLAITIPVLILRTRRVKAEATVPVEDQATKELSL